MPDRRSVDDLSIEELEQILLIKKREARLERLKRLEQAGRRRGDVDLPDVTNPQIHVSSTQPQQTQTEPGSIEFESFVRSDEKRKRTLRDKLLVAVEIAAALGIVALLVYAAISLQEINQQSAEAQAAQLEDLPTPTATPLITAVVLPGGHTPPTAPGGAQPNYSEVPAELVPLVEQQFAGPIVLPTPAPSNPVRIRIPSLGVDATIVQGDGWEQLKKGVGHHIGSADPGNTGNVVLSAHNDIYGEIFRKLDRISEGDEIFINTTTQEYRYVYSSTDVVTPTEVSVMEQTTDPRLTLISCYPYLINTQRIVIVADLVQ